MTESRIDIPASEIGKYIIDIGNGVHLVLINPGEKGYEDGKIAYRCQGFGVYKQNDNIARISG